jgi:hypothetical protein
MKPARAWLLRKLQGRLLRPARWYTTEELERIYYGYLPEVATTSSYRQLVFDFRERERELKAA